MGKINDVEYSVPMATGATKLVVSGRKVRIMVVFRSLRFTLI